MTTTGKTRLMQAAFLLLLLGPDAAHSQTADQEQVGRAAAAQILGAASLDERAEVVRYVNLLGRSIAEYANADYKWRFGIVATDSVNGFATPGGIILLTRGLIDVLANEDELAFVLAHEVAHVIRRHHYSVVQRQRLVERAAQTLQAASDSDVANLSQTSGVMYARGLDKGAEFEADRLGVEWVTRAGYDPAAALGVLEKIQRLGAADPRAALMFSTHPSPNERLDQLLRAGIDRLPQPRTLSNVKVTRFAEFKRHAVGGRSAAQQ
jgi:predicted Zn-dependent protease